MKRGPLHTASDVSRFGLSSSFPSTQSINQLRRYSPRPIQRTINSTKVGTAVRGTRTASGREDARIPIVDDDEVESEVVGPRSFTIEAMGRATSASETTSRSSPTNVDGSCAALRVLTVTIFGWTVEMPLLAVL